MTEIKGFNALTKQAAFTLAEVLITLGIIGVVAAMTLPNLISNAYEKATVSRVKSTYSILSQGVKMAIEEYGEVSSWCSPSSSTVNSERLACAENIFKVLSTSIKLGTCEARYGYPCFAEKYRSNKWAAEKTQNFVPATIVLSKGVLLNGTSISIDVGTGDGNPSKVCTASVNTVSGTDLYVGTCATIYVDINGASGPNIDGKDLFAFKLYTDGILPLGRQQDKIWVDNFQEQCLNKNNRKRTWGSCTGWVIEKGNMDYLHTQNLTY